MSYQYCSRRWNSTVSDMRNLSSRLNKHIRMLLIGCWFICMGTGIFCVPALAQTPAAGISANPTSIASGGSSTLTWTTRNAVSADLNGTPVELNGSQIVSPTASTTYRITARNSAGAIDWGQVLVTVTSAAPTAGISANPTSIAGGGSSTLTWTSTNALSATLNGAAVAVNGSQAVSPASTTTYTFITTSSSGATATAQATVTVGSTDPTAGITADPASIPTGGSATLTWTSTNAVSATLNGAAVAVNGTQTVSPSATTTYTFIATSSSGGTATAQTTVTVNASSGPPAAGIVANPTSIASGSSSTLTWTTKNAVSADLNGAQVALNGSQTVSPTASTTYRITARNAAGAIDWGQVVVTVTSSGPTAGITANPTSIASGGSSTLTWTSTNAASATLNGATVPVSGSQTVSPTAKTTYTFIVTGSTGTTAQAQATVTVGPADPTAGIAANPTSIASGSSSTLTWTSTNATSATLNGATVPVSGSQTVSPTATTTYTFIATGSTGTTAQAQATVTVGPAAPTAGISANPTSIASGGSSTLTWTSTNAASATLNGATVQVNGSQTVSPTATTTYTFIATSSSGTTAQAQATVTVGPAAPTAGIAANPTSIASGGSSTLTWTSTNAASATLNGAAVQVNGSQTVSPTATTTYTFIATSSSGATAQAQATVTVGSSGPPAAGIVANPTLIAPGGNSTLTWTTNNAVSADLNGTTVALNGSQTVSPTVTTTYRITAKNSAGATDWGQATVKVTTVAINASPSSIPPGGSSTLTWATTNAVSATLNGASVAVNGSQAVSPTTTTTYTLVATNSAGTSASAQTVVIVGSSGSPTAGISANPPSIISGGSSTLTWTSTNAASATLNGASVAVNGSQTVSPTATTTYNFVATGSSGITASAQTTLTVTSNGPPTAGISANPTSIVVGNSATLTWTTNNAVNADLNGVAVALNGSQIVSPTTTTTYRITARSSSGAIDWGQITVTVVGAGTVTGQWGPVQTWPFMAAHAALLPNGSVLFWPSFLNGNNPYLWNPATNQFTAVPMASYNIFCSGHSFLQDGKLFLAGGHAGNQSDGLINSTFYDPITNTWTATANMNAPRWYPTNTTLPNNDVLVVSGFTTTGNFNTLPQVWHPADGTWRNLTSAQLMQPLYPMMFVAPNGKVFSAGPDRITRYLDTSGTGTWTSVATINYTGTRDYGSAVIFDGKVMIAGGDGETGAATNTVELLDLNAANPTWQNASPMSIARRQFNLTLLPDGKLLASGGSGGFGFDNSAKPIYPSEMWDPATGNWTTMDSITVYRGYHSTALLLPDGRVLSAGGEITGASAEIYSPPYLFKGARPTITSAPTSVQYGQTFPVGTPDATNITQVTWIRLSAVTHSFNQNQRLNRLQFAQATGGLNITAPANANLAPPGHYMLFLVNGNGVPSVAKIIQITP